MFALKDVCDFRPAKAEARSRLRDADPVSFVPMEDLGIDHRVLKPEKTRLLSEVNGSYTYFANGDVLLAKITPCFENGKLGIAQNLVNGVGFGSSEYIVLRPRGELTNEWLYYCLSRSGFRALGAASMSGAVGHKRVSKDFIESYQIPVPPLSEQQRLTRALDELLGSISEARDRAKRNIQNSRALFDQHLAAVFNDAQTEVTLEHVAVEITDGGHMPPPKSKAGIPFITISNINRQTREIDFS
ncbi:MAG TPA: restriction endonuclease subunit S, partial [Anaeromyxobacteraceae bacterium]